MMPRTKPTARKGPGGMILRQQISNRDSCLPSVVAPVAPTAVTAAPTAVTAVDVKRNVACVPACTAAAAMLGYIPDPVDGEVLEGALGQAFFAALDQTDWESRVLLFRPLGFGVLLWSGLLKATADVSLCFARQA